MEEFFGSSSEGAVESSSAGGAESSLELGASSSGSSGDKPQRRRPRAEVPDADLRDIPAR